MAAGERFGELELDVQPHINTSTSAATATPPLENGGRLTRLEFERRYEAMPRLKKAELIDGVVFVPSPVRYAQHWRPNSGLETWLGVYRAATPGTMSTGNTTV